MSNEEQNETKLVDMTEISLYNGGGFIKLVDSMGSDLSVVNSARVSYADKHSEFQESDHGLVNYLARNEHYSPFRHSFVSFHIKAPIFVTRQAWKHVVGIETAEVRDGENDGVNVSAFAAKDCGWNEVSGRYVQFKRGAAWRCVKGAWRSAPVKGQSKQGSSEPLDESKQDLACDLYDRTIETIFAAYENLLSLGVCREQARAMLPLSLYTEWHWSMSLQAAAHFVRLRRATDAQSEIRELADAMHTYLLELFPHTYTRLIESPSA